MQTSGGEEVVSKMFGTFQDLILSRLEQIETIPAAMVGDPKLGKFLLQAGEFLDAAELTELYEVVGLSVAQRNRFISAYTLCAFRDLSKSF
jgi:hypothetical protein